MSECAGVSDEAYIHCRYLFKCYANTGRHHDREAEPKDYAIGEDKEKWDLLRATYKRIGNVADGVREWSGGGVVDAVGEGVEWRGSGRCSG